MNTIFNRRILWIATIILVIILISILLTNNKNSSSILNHPKWQMVKNNEFRNSDIWAGSGIYFYEEENSAYCILMIYGSGLPVMGQYASELTLDNNGTFHVRVPKRFSTGYLSSISDSTDPVTTTGLVDVIIQIEEKQVIWGDLTYVLSENTFGYDYVQKEIKSKSLLSTSTADEVEECDLAVYSFDLSIPPLFTSDDILYVDWEQQVWYFKTEFIRNLGHNPEQSLNNNSVIDIEGADLLGEHSQFTIMLNGNPVYEGYFQPPAYSSFFPIGPVIQDYGNTAIKIVNNLLDDNEDLRYNEELRVYLDKQGLLISKEMLSDKEILNKDYYGSVAYPLFASIPKADIYLYERSNHKDLGAILVHHNKIQVFDWTLTTPRYILPRLALADLTNDDKDELICINNVGSGTGVSIDELHVLTLDDNNDYVDHFYLQWYEAISKRLNWQWNDEETTILVNTDDGDYNIQVPQEYKKYTSLELTINPDNVSFSYNQGQLIIEVPLSLKSKDVPTPLYIKERLVGEVIFVNGEFNIIDSYIEKKY